MDFTYFLSEAAMLAIQSEASIEAVTKPADGSAFDKCVGAKFTSYPTGYQFLTVISAKPSPLFYVLIIASIVYLVVLAMGAKMWRDVTKIRDEHIRGDVLLCISMPSICASFCVLGMCFPRSSPLMSSLTMLTMLFAYWRCLSLFFRLYGDSYHMSDLMYRSYSRIHLNTAPFCCCCRCCPTFKPSKRNILVLKYLVLQTPILRITMQIATSIIRSEGGCDNTVEIKVLNWAGLASTVTAVYAAFMLVYMSNIHLVKYRIGFIFRALNTAQGIINIQRFLLEWMSTKQKGFKDVYLRIPGTGPEGSLDVLEARVQADFWNNALSIMWFVPVSIMLLVNVRPHVSALFELRSMPNAHIDMQGEFKPGSRRPTITSIFAQPVNIMSTYASMGETNHAFKHESQVHRQHAHLEVEGGSHHLDSVTEENEKDKKEESWTTVETLKV